MMKKSSEKKTVLIVDDDPHILELVKDTLGMGYSVLSATTGYEALQTLHTRNVDMAIVDIMLSDGKMDGYEICRHIKKNKETQHVPVLMLSAKKELDDKLTAVDAGADDYMAKPFSPEELAKRVRLNLFLNP